MSSVLAYRQAVERDLPFIYDSFLESYRTSHAAGLIQMADWDDIMRDQFGKVLSRPGCIVWVAFHPFEDDPKADLYGWLAAEAEVLIPHQTTERVNGRTVRSEQLAPAGCPLVHYLFVKQAYRRQGIARGLFKAAGVNPAERFLHTCKTAVLSGLKAKAPNATWSPLVARHAK